MVSENIFFLIPANQKRKLPIAAIFFAKSIRNEEFARRKTVFINKSF